MTHTFFFFFFAQLVVFAFPEVAGVGGTVAVAGVAGQVGAFDGFPGHAARHGGGIDQAQELVPGRGIPCQGGDRGRDQGPGGPEAFVVAGLVRDPGKHAGQVDLGVADPPRLGGEAQEVLGHCQTQQFRVAEYWFTPWPPGPGHAQIRQDLVVSRRKVWSGECLVECSQTRLNTLRLTLKASTPVPAIGLTHFGGRLRSADVARVTALPARLDSRAGNGRQHPHRDVRAPLGGALVSTSDREHRGIGVFKSHDVHSNGLPIRKAARQTDAGHTGEVRSGKHAQGSCQGVLARGAGELRGSSRTRTVRSPGGWAKPVRPRRRGPWPRV